MLIHQRESLPFASVILLAILLQGKESADSGASIRLDRVVVLVISVFERTRHLSAAYRRSRRLFLWKICIRES